MAKQVDIVALGDLLIDFTEAGQSQDGRRLFEQVWVYRSVVVFRRFRPE